MAKEKVVFFCKECGYESPKWMGQCPGCKEWNSFSEAPKTIRTSRTSKNVGISEARGNGAASKPARISEISVKEEGSIYFMYREKNH